MTTQLDAIFLRRLEQELWNTMVQFGEAPSATGLLEVAAAAELVLVTEESVFARQFSSMIRSHVELWIKRGLLEDLLFAEPDYAYQTALLAAFVPTERIESLSKLWEHGLLGRAEWPMLQQIVITSSLAKGVPSEIAGLLDKVPRWFDLGRLTLRSTHDDRDLHALLQLTQVLRLRTHGIKKFRHSQVGCSKLCQELLALNLRRGDLNRVSVLAYLGSCFFECPAFLLSAARQAILSSAVSWELFAPFQEQLPGTQGDMGLTYRALTLRSALAWPLFLTTYQGSLSDDD